MSRMIELETDDNNFVTVGHLIKALEKLPKNLKIMFIESWYSYRALKDVGDLYINDDDNLLYIGGDADEDDEAY